MKTMKRLFELEVPNTWSAVSAGWLCHFLTSSDCQSQSCASQIKITEIVATPWVGSSYVLLTPLVDEAELRQKIAALRKGVDNRRSSIRMDQDQIAKLLQQLDRQQELRGEKR